MIVSFLEASESQGAAAESRIQVDRRPPYPQCSLIGRLLCDLNAMPLYLYGHSPACQKAIEVQVDEMTLGLFWLVKLKWQSGFKFPKEFMQRYGNPSARKKAREASRPAGEWLVSVLNLCMETHSIIEMGAEYDGPEPFESAPCWLCSIALETSSIGGLPNALLDLYGDKTGKVSKRSKRNLIRSLSNIVGRMKTEKEKPNQPFSPLGRLITASVQLSERNDIFRRQSFDPFLKATKAYIKAMDGDAYTTLYLDAGRGDRLALYKNLSNGGRNQKLYSETRSVRGLYELLPNSAQSANA